MKLAFRLGQAAMSSGRLVAMASCIAGAAIGAQTARADDRAPERTISKAEARALPPDAVKRRVLDQLSDLLTEQRLAHSRPPVAMLTDLEF